MEQPPPWQDELTPDQLEQFLGVQDDPFQLMDLLRTDDELLVAVARADTRPHLVHWFSEQDVDGGAWRHDPERTGPIGPLAAGVEWSWAGMHDDVGLRGAFNGIAPSGREVIVRGVSLMGVEDEQFSLRRYVDWAGVYAQLGLTLNWRTPVRSEQ